MLSRQCPFCENVNPPNSKFCNACGVKLHAALCPHCGAVNVLSATVCVSCAAELPDAATVAKTAQAIADADTAGSDAASLVHATAHAEPPLVPLQVPALETVPPLAFSVHFDRDHAVKIDRGPDGRMPLNSHLAELTATRANERRELEFAHTQQLPELTLAANGHVVHPSVPGLDARTAPVALPDRRYRRYATLLGIVAVVAMLAGSAYYLYHAHTLAEMAALIATSRELKGPDTSADAGNNGSEAQRATVADTTGPPAIVTPAERVAGPAGTSPQPAVTANDPRKPRAAGAQIAPAEATATATVSAGATQAKAASPSNEAAPQPLEPCTATVAALGLCTRESPNRKGGP
jgi:Double zinc ribbon